MREELGVRTYRRSSMADCSRTSLFLSLRPAKILSRTSTWEANVAEVAMLAGDVATGVEEVKC